MDIDLGNGSFFYDVPNSHIIMNVTRVQPILDLPVDMVIYTNKVWHARESDCALHSFSALVECDTINPCPRPFLMIFRSEPKHQL